MTYCEDRLGQHRMIHSGMIGWNCMIYSNRTIRWHRMTYGAKCHALSAYHPVTVGIALLSHHHISYSINLPFCHCMRHGDDREAWHHIIYNNANKETKKILCADEKWSMDSLKYDEQKTKWHRKNTVIQWCASTYEIDPSWLDSPTWVAATDCAVLLWIAAAGDSAPSAEWRPVSQWDDLAGGMSRGTTDSKILGKCGWCEYILLLDWLQHDKMQQRNEFSGAVW